MNNGDVMTSVEVARPEKTVPLNDPSLYINRELSLLDFQYRVFEEAQDTSNPLLERAKVLGDCGLQYG